MAAIRSISPHVIPLFSIEGYTYLSIPKSFSISKEQVAIATELALPNMEAASINNKMIVELKTNHLLKYF